MIRSEKSEKYYSSDEDEYLLNEEEPLLNIFGCGWLEDNRTALSLADFKIQSSPHPVTQLRNVVKSEGGIQFICKKAVAGSKHTVFLMINYLPDDGVHDKEKTKKVMMVGLNQLGLVEGCEVPIPTDVSMEAEETPINIFAGFGTIFIVSRFGNVFSYGQNRFGVLGHGDEVSLSIPRKIMELDKYRIKAVACGQFHTLAITYTGRLYSWGRNHCGQLGRTPAETEMELVPDRVDFFTNNDKVEQICCGASHCLVLAKISRKDNAVYTLVYAWGDHTRGQLSNAEPRHRWKPQEMRLLTGLTRKMKISVTSIAAGGVHNLALTAPVGQVIAWGGGDYGQLGNGFIWDEPRPKMLNGLKDVFKISAGYRHSMALSTDRITKQTCVYGWGYNGFGELGLGDTNIRLQATRITALDGARVKDVTCGDRHTVFVTDHRPLRNRDDPKLKEFFDLIQLGKGSNVKAVLKARLKQLEMDPTLLDRPDERLLEQTGDKDAPLEQEKFESGLQYCMETKCDPGDWRKKTYDIVFSCAPLRLNTVCMACARRCHRRRHLVTHLRKRVRGDKCDCYYSSHCTIRWSVVREKFDNVAADDECISPSQLRPLLTVLRSPEPLDDADMDDCIGDLAEGDEESDLPRITAAVFEAWYNRHFRKYDEHS